jgi:hypothetical protein
LGHPRIVACGQGVFVSPRWAKLARQGLPPWINGLVTRPLPDGASPLLPTAEVRAANAGAGLIGLVTRWAITGDQPSLEDATYLRSYLYQSFSNFSRGYRFQELLIEATGERACDEAIRAGFRLLNDYAEYYRRCPPLPSPAERPFLLGLTREEALADAGSFLHYAFACASPRWNLEPFAQQMLACALGGASDEEIAQRLGWSVSKIHKGWLDIYKRVEERSPGLLPVTQPDQRKRGREKRAVLLRYLEEHPEEIRPHHQ